MPKGVEHATKSVDDESVQEVNFPLMPKGVEHSFDKTPAQTNLTREFSIDAERR